MRLRTTQAASTLSSPTYIQNSRPKARHRGWVRAFSTNIESNSPTGQEAQRSAAFQSSSEKDGSNFRRASLNRSSQVVTAIDAPSLDLPMEWLGGRTGAGTMSARLDWRARAEIACLDTSL